MFLQENLQYMIGRNKLDYPIKLEAVRLVFFFFCTVGLCQSQYLQCRSIETIHW